MPKKISIYTAFGQFIEMIEATTATNQIQEETEKDTDNLLCDFFTLSDYQQNLSTLQIQTCPTVVYDKADYSLCEIRKIKSCPNFILPPTIKWQIPMALSSTDSSYFLNLATPAMLQYWEDIQSPIPTTIETRKLNDATSDMISFWKIHVQSRRKPSAQQQAEPNIIEQISTEYFVPTPINPSIFEKLNGVFENTYKSPITSWYQDMQRLFDESPDVFTSSFLENFNQFFSPKSEEKDEWPIGPLNKDSTANHSLNCLCYNCWRQSAFTRTAPTNECYSSNAPTLPVFVKSPVDSLNLYNCGKISQIDSAIDSENVSTSGNQADAEDSDSDSGSTLDFSSDSESTDSTSGSTLDFYIRENELLTAKTKIQNVIIKKFMALVDIDDALIKLRDE
ncbi:unnamed protein product [Caenorhabditis angaria]|uniref:Uncharacterized protein n=1 Tax=Caenorhabditis angaria TaxID=860376 RepID=A0A9P1N123_9PELO|nr:unnamed protein product [Caenorhabditis angaria]